MTGHDDFMVPVKTWLKPGLYRVLGAAARAHGTSVELLVAECVRRVLAADLLPLSVPVKHRRQRWTAADTARLVELHGEGLTDARIASEMSRPVSTVFKHRDELGLQSLRAPLGRPPVGPAA